MTTRIQLILVSATIAVATGCPTSNDDDGSDDLAADEDDDGSGASTDDGTVQARCDIEDRDEPFALGLMHEGEAVRVAIADAVPATPVRGDNSWTVRITDLSNSPMEGMALDVSPWMVDHGHPGGADPIVTALDDGQYQIERVNLYMAGYWEVTIDVTDTAGNADEVVFKVCVE